MDIAIIHFIHYFEIIHFSKTLFKFPVLGILPYIDGVCDCIVVISKYLRVLEY
uniref:Uncharacterized protein n=1 Tax=Anguilla anguilla TaxID=7936 RepID=A0A0E9TYQ7_ANGAN